MAEENGTDAVTGTVEVNETSTEAPQKKQRAPRRQKAEVDAAKARKAGATTRRKRGEKEAAGASAKPAEVQLEAAKSEARVPAKRGRKPKSSIAAESVTTQPVSAMDEMADLIQLEEENKRLRNTLAEKLRGENAELRKRLGIA
ncbi:MAG: SyrB-like regulator [Pseudorhizobium sp.]